jgi:hypothetical protein
MKEVHLSIAMSPSLTTAAIAARSDHKCLTVTKNENETNRGGHIRVYTPFMMTVIIQNNGSRSMHLQLQCRQEEMCGIFGSSWNCLVRHSLSKEDI